MTAVALDRDVTFREVREWWSTTPLRIAGPFINPR